MQMTFYWGYDATILFPWWQCSTALEFYLSCFCIFIMCLGSSKLKAICHELQQERPRGIQSVVLAGCSEPSLATAAGSATGIDSSQSPVTADGNRWRGAPPLLQPSLSHSLYNVDPGSWSQMPAQHQYGVAEGRRNFLKAKPLAVWLLTLVSVMIDWGMMLVCMTFNAGLFLAVVAGVATGQLLLQHVSERSNDCCSAVTHG